MAANRLPQKKEELAQAFIIMQGNKTAAYRKVYPDSKATPETMWVLACKAFKDDKVGLRIQELQDLAIERHLVTVETITAELEESYKMAKSQEQSGHMTTSSVAKGKLHGLFIEKRELSGSINLTNLSNQELEDIANGD